MFKFKFKPIFVLAGSLSLIPWSVSAAYAGEVSMEITRSSSADGGGSNVQTTTTSTTTTVQQNDSLIPPGITVVQPGSGTIIERREVISQPVLAPGSVVQRTIVTGNAVPLSISEAPVILQTVEIRRSDLDKRIIDARAASTLSEAQAAEFRRELDRIGSEVSYLRSQPNPSLVRSIVMAQDLDVLANRFRTRFPTTTLTYVPIIEGSHFTVFNGRVVELDDLAVRRIELENKILAEQASGRISWDQANHLRSNLNAIAAQEEIFRSDGTLTFKESRTIYTDMDKVAHELDNMAR